MRVKLGSYLEPSAYSPGRFWYRAQTQKLNRYSAVTVDPPVRGSNAGAKPGRSPETRQYSRAVREWGLGSCIQAMVMARPCSRAKSTEGWEALLVAKRSMRALRRSWANL